MSKIYELGNYSVYSKEIGKGAYSKVYQGYDTITKEHIAVKIINKNKIKETILAKINYEIELLSKCDHENVLSLKKVLFDKNHVYIITELCNGTLNDVIKDLTEREVFFYFNQIRTGIKYLYDNSIVHRDIKPQNILIKYKNVLCPHGDLSNIVVKISDFGFAKMFKEETDMFETLCGTPNYLAPEMLIHNTPNIKSDLWSLGCVLYQMLHNKMIQGKVLNILDLTKKLQTIDVESIIDKSNVSDDCQDLLLHLLKVNPNERMSWNDFFTHRWFELHNELESCILPSVDDSMIQDVRGKMFQTPESRLVPSTINLQVVEEHYTSTNAIDIPMKPLQKPVSSSVPLWNTSTFTRFNSDPMTFSPVEFIKSIIPDFKITSGDLHL